MNLASNDAKWTLYSNLASPKMGGLKVFCARFGQFSQKGHFQPKISVNMTEFQNFRNLDTFFSLQWHMTVIWLLTGVAIELGDLEIWGCT